MIARGKCFVKNFIPLFAMPENGIIWQIEGACGMMR
jgi:hypothetical protein